jgi:hypothetical protein
LGYAGEVRELDTFAGAGLAEVGLAGFGAVIFASGFCSDFCSWLPWPDAFDDASLPLEIDGRRNM